MPIIGPGVTVGPGVSVTAVPPVTSGLSLFLDTGNSTSYPGTGTAWSDLSGNGNNGTLVNSPAYTAAGRDLRIGLWCLHPPAFRRAVASFHGRAEWSIERHWLEN